MVQVWRSPAELATGADEVVRRFVPESRAIYLERSDGPPDTCTRLAEVKRRWDPGGMIRANHEVSLAPA